jgi:hypothetical protein
LTGNDLKFKGELGDGNSAFYQNRAAAFHLAQDYGLAMFWTSCQPYDRPRCPVGFKTFAYGHGKVRSSQSQHLFLLTSSRYTMPTLLTLLLMAVMEEEMATTELYVDHQTCKESAGGLAAPSLATRNAARVGGRSHRTLTSASRRPGAKLGGTPNSVAKVFTPSTPTNATIPELWPQTCYRAGWPRMTQDWLNVDRTISTLSLVDRNIFSTISGTRTLAGLVLVSKATFLWTERLLYGSLQVRFKTTIHKLQAGTSEASQSRIL